MGKVWLFVSLAALPAAAASAQERDAAPAVFTNVTACQSVRPDAARLACFDAAVAALVQAQTAREVVVVDREEVRRTGRTLFGLRLPSLGRLFGEEGENEIQSTIAAAEQGPGGLWTLQLEDGAVWAQTEGRMRPRPRAGLPIRIRRGALGSYLANIQGQPAVRVVRRR